MPGRIYSALRPKFDAASEGRRRGHQGQMLKDFIQGCKNDKAKKYGRGRRYNNALP